MTYTPPAHTPYQWKNKPSTDTPLDEAHLEAAEQDLEDYTKAGLVDLAAYTDAAVAAAQAAAIAASAQGLTPTAVKTGTYTAAAGDFVPADISGGSFTVTLPNAPADKTRIGVKVIKVDGSHANAATVARAGSDVFNLTGGSTSLTLSALFQGVLLQYKASSGIWYVSTADTPVGQANGAGSLDATGRQPIAQAPLSVESALSGTITPAMLATTYGAKGDGKILYNAVMVGASKVLNSTDTGVNFTNADVGKTIIVSGVGTANEALVTTIASVQSASQCTLTAAAVVSSPDSAGNQIAVYGTDDTAAIQAASDAAAAANSGTLEFDAKVYIVAGALVQGGARKTNSQITLPYKGQVGGIGVLCWKGARDSSGVRLPLVPAGGTILVSTLIGQTYSATYGVPSVVGSATQEQAAGGESAFSDWLFNCENLALLTPRNPSLGGFNLERVSSQNRRNVTVGTLEYGYNNSAGDTLTISQPSNQWAAGIIEPMNQNADAGVCDRCVVYGYFVGHVPSEHTTVPHMSISANRVAIGIRNGYVHPVKYSYLAAQMNRHFISGWDPTQASASAAIVAVPAAGAAGGNGLQIDSFDIEDFSDTSGGVTWGVVQQHVNDSGNNLLGWIRFSRWSWVSGVYTYQTSLLVTGGAHLGISLTNPSNVVDLLPKSNVIDSLMPWTISFLPHGANADAALKTGTWAFSGITGITGAYLFNSSNAQNDEIGWDFALAAGTWTFTLIYGKQSNAAIITINLAGSSVGTIDTYAVSATNGNVTAVSGIVVPTTGKWRVSLKGATRNASNTTGWSVLLQLIQLRRTA